MSFLAGSECAANANPLAQFSKQTQHDTSLEQSFRNSAQNAGAEGRFRGPAMMNETERAHMDRFMNQGSSFNFQPMASELNMIHSGPQAQMIAGPQAPQLPEISQQPITQQPQASSRSGWSSEFQNSANEQITNIPAQLDHSMMRSLGAGPRLQLRPMGGAPMGMMQTHNMTQQESDQQIDWDQQFKEMEELDSQAQEPVEETVNAEESAFDQVWDNLQDTYADHMLSNDEFQSQWEKDFEKYAQTRLNYGEYSFEQNNQFKNNPDAYEIGLKLMEGGAKLSEAALAFEAAVEQNPAHVNAWLRLGQVQTQNEKELAGIAALEKCLELSPQNLVALMTLAISYINEGYDNAAFATLERWIETKYPVIADRARADNPEIQADDRFSLNKRVTELFIKAAQISPEGANMDSEVQTGLGVLFYSMEEYDKTLDCFQAAIQHNPDDALAWNRLGASLANSNKPEQAIEAYSRALQLNPNFVRARYNLGVSFINMGMYRDAVDHLLTGLSMHEVETLDGSNSAVRSNQSTSLLETLKRAFLAMDRRDLLDKIRPGLNVETFRRTYDV
ncbi:hypothetical protein OGAPHI_003195 [Ogataea philodendri]|uniref:Peroxisomal targeting signal receptor n=2 Tax=Saccharomycotina TaxID=147537 RepID=A0A9P8P7X5_9ASCO|nr:uncharacterized protein OGAPHI_003195 [Ogataea philodendri]KAH3666746.1 hypothetical protein OGAPHI_003195 [Ogataea philodendri]